MPSKASTHKSPYCLHPAYAYVESVVAGLPERTGKPLDEWIRILKESGITAPKERTAWLKSVHGLGMTTAGVIVERAEGRCGADNYHPEALVADLFSGPREALLPLYERLLSLGLSLAKDVKACPCKTFVPLYRNHVIAQIKPTTRTRIDFGLALGKTKVPSRLVSTGGLKKGDRITHVIPVTTMGDIDTGVERWLKKAYELDLK